jgi:hypothetical protein
MEIPKMFSVGLLYLPDQTQRDRENGAGEKHETLHQVVGRRPIL